MDMAEVHNQKSMQRLLEAHGWARGKAGKHVVRMQKKGQRPITLPMHKGRDYSVGRSTTKTAAIGPRSRNSPAASFQAMVLKNFGRR
jgi:predicted RNA binding protein YcfA (HicA-like mRNA interferase family)